MHFTHITQKIIFPVTKQVFFVSINEENVQTRFQMINFMLYNLKIMMNNLDFKSKTHTLSNFCLTNVISINSNIFKIAKNVIQSFIELKFKIVIHQNNSLN